MCIYHFESNRKVKAQIKNKDNKITSDEDNLLFLQNLKSRFFLISIVGEILEELADKPLNKKFVKYKYNTSLATNNSLDDLINLWSPVIAAILPFIIRVTGQDSTTYLSETEDPLHTVASEVKNNLRSLKAFQPIEPLRILAENLGNNSWVALKRHPTILYN